MRCLNCRRLSWCTSFSPTELGTLRDNTAFLLAQGRAPVRSAAGRLMVMSGVPASDGSCTRARLASHVWNASVDVRRRTRRNAYTIRRAAPELNHRTSCRGSRGSASLPSPNLIVKPRMIHLTSRSQSTAYFEYSAMCFLL